MHWDINTPSPLSSKTPPPLFFAKPFLNWQTVQVPLFRQSPHLSKFLGKISQFEFLVMTGKNIFAYKLFLSLNISDFNLFFYLKLQPPLQKGERRGAHYGSQHRRGKNGIGVQLFWIKATGYMLIMKKG